MVVSLFKSRHQLTNLLQRREVRLKKINAWVAPDHYGCRATLGKCERGGFTYARRCAVTLQTLFGIDFSIVLRIAPFCGWGLTAL